MNVNEANVRNPLLTAPAQAAIESAPAAKTSTPMDRAIPVHPTDVKSTLNATALPLSTPVFARAQYPACFSADAGEFESTATCSSSSSGFRSSVAKHDRQGFTGSTGKCHTKQQTTHSPIYKDPVRKRLEPHTSSGKDSYVSLLKRPCDQKPSSSSCDQSKCYSSPFNKRDRGTSPADHEVVTPKYSRPFDEDDLLISMSYLSLTPTDDKKGSASSAMPEAASIKLRITEIAGVTEAWRTSGTLYYRGGWKLGMPHGEGEYFRSNGSTRYKGQILNNRFHGFGTSYRRDGSVEYRGYWHNGLQISQAPVLSDRTSSSSSSCDHSN